MSMNNIDGFIEEYKKLEEAVKRVYNVGQDASIVTVLKKYWNAFL